MHEDTAASRLTVIWKRHSRVVKEHSPQKHTFCSGKMDEGTVVLVSSGTSMQHNRISLDDSRHSPPLDCFCYRSIGLSPESNEPMRRCPAHLSGHEPQQPGRALREEYRYP
jgi:hypothetical protein